MRWKIKARTGRDTNSLMTARTSGVEGVHMSDKCEMKGRERCGHEMIRRIQMIMLISTRSEIYKPRTRL